jgi:excisionase family DNA binding protein
VKVSEFKRMMRKDAIAPPLGSAVYGLNELVPLICEADPTDCPELIGMLEQLKAYAWARMLHPKVSSSPDDDLMDMVQVAKKLNIPPCRAYELARQGKIPTVKIGKYVRVTCTALKKYEEQLPHK